MHFLSYILSSFAPPKQNTWRAWKALKGGSKWGRCCLCKSSMLIRIWFRSCIVDINWGFVKVGAVDKGWIFNKVRDAILSQSFFLNCTFPTTACVTFTTACRLLFVFRDLKTNSPQMSAAQPGPACHSAAWGKSLAASEAKNVTRKTSNYYEKPHPLWDSSCHTTSLSLFIISDLLQASHQTLGCLQLFANASESNLIRILR